MDRQEHLAWCKERALEYVKLGKLDQALTSLYSDLGKHEGTAGHPGIGFVMMKQSAGFLTGSLEVKKFIEGFN